MLFLTKTIKDEPWSENLKRYEKLLGMAEKNLKTVRARAYGSTAST
jgi:hypothetical protein